MRSALAPVRLCACTLLLLSLASCGGDTPVEPPGGGRTSDGEVLAALAAIREDQAELRRRIDYTSSQVEAMVKRGIMVVPPGDSWEERAAFRIPAHNSPGKGPVDAPVRVFVFADFECPYCRAAAGIPDQLLAAFPNDVQVFFKHNPLTRRHPLAAGAARAAIAAGQQGKFWEMHDLLFSTQRLTPEDLREHARALGLDVNKFERSLNAGNTSLALSRDRTLARDVGADVTPTFFVNGKRVDGTSYEAVRAAVEAELRLLAESGQEVLDRSALNEPSATAPAAGPDDAANAPPPAPADAASGS